MYSVDLPKGNVPGNMSTPVQAKQQDTGTTTTTQLSSAGNNE